jgi:hypothetical protein
VSSRKTDGPAAPKNVVNLIDALRSLTVQQQTHGAVSSS